MPRVGRRTSRGELALVSALKEVEVWAKDTFVFANGWYPLARQEMEFSFNRDAINPRYKTHKDDILAGTTQSL